MTDSERALKGTEGLSQPSLVSIEGMTFRAIVNFVAIFAIKNQ